MKHHSRKLRIFTCAAVIVACLTGVTWSAFAREARAAEGDPSVSIATKTEHIDGSATSFVVPVTLNTGTHDDISSVSFALDYAETCVRIDDTATDITGVPSGFASSFDNDRDAGKLQVSIWRNNAQSPLSAGTLISIKFTLEPACRPGAGNLTDPTTTFSFVAPLPTFGSTLGANIPGSGTNGTYTLDLNQAPTDIALADLAMTENVGSARKIATLTVADSDNAPADTHTFTFSGACSGAFDNQGFVLDPSNSANLRTDRVFDYEGVGSYAICVQVTDGQGGAYVEKLTLSVVDANDAPTDIALSSNTVAQGAAAGTTVGTLTTTDEDAGQTFTYTLLETGEGSEDSAKFTLADNLLKINSPVDFLVQPEYRVRIRATDNGDPAKSVAKQFRVLVNGVSVLSLPDESDLPSVLAGEQVIVPVSFAPNGNTVMAMSFQVDYSETCLDFVELADIQSGFSDSGADVADDGHVNVSLTTAGQSPLGKGTPVSLVFAGTAGCAAASSWTSLTFAAAPVMTGPGNTPYVTTSHAGKLAVLAADSLGDCNADGAVNAGDFSATALELFDTESDDTSGTMPFPNSWLWTPLGDRGFSARGCDSNGDRTMLVSDLQCTVRLFFGAACTAAPTVAAAAAPAVVSVPAAAGPLVGQVAAVPLTLQTNAHDVAAFAASVSFDPTKLALDPADADADGVPDAVHFQLPAGMYRMAAYDAAAGRIDLVATGVVMPLPKLADGIVVTLDLQPAAGADGTAAPITLDNLSLGDSSGGTVPAVVETTSPLGRGGQVFLPAIMP